MIGFAGIEISQTYTGTVTFLGDIGFGSYSQAGGTVDQPDGTALDPLNKKVSVGGTFMWTGGSIEGPGTYHLQGSGGRIGLDNSLTTGSKFILDKSGPASLPTYSQITQSGTLSLTRDANIEIKSGFLTQQRINGAASRPAITSLIGLTGDNGIIIRSEGMLTSHGGAVPSLLNDNGRVYVTTGGLEVTGKLPGSQWGFKMKGNGITEIKNGETLKAANGVYVESGRLETLFNLAANQIATIDGLFRMDGGTVQLGLAPDEGHVGYSELHVKGRAELHGGTFKTKTDDNNRTDRDAIMTTDKLDTRAAFSILPFTNGPAGMGTPVLVSTLGFTTESVDRGNPDNTKWIMERDGTDNKEFWLRKKP